MSVSLFKPPVSQCHFLKPPVSQCRQCHFLPIDTPLYVNRVQKYNLIEYQHGVNLHKSIIAIIYAWTYPITAVTSVCID